MVDDELHDDGFGDGQVEFDAEACPVPAGPVAQGAGVTACRVGGRGFSQKFAYGVRGLFGQLRGQQQLSGRRGEGREGFFLLHTMYYLLRIGPYSHDNHHLSWVDR